MTTRPCDGCGEDVTIAGGIAGIWSTSPETTGGITLEPSTTPNTSSVMPASTGYPTTRR